jgi:peroxiredoxin Q/BCP
MKKTALFTLALVAASVVQASAQGAPAVSQVSRPAPEVGAVAPDFTLPGATRYGKLTAPVKLSDFRGKTVVLAFFPAARTRGCTVQMRAYRDQYGELFNNGRNVVVIGISVDPIETLQSWASEEDFPLIFASDTSRSVAGLYGAHGTSERASRNLFVVDPQGRIAYRALPFREVDPTAYDALAAEIDKLQPGG